MGWLFFLGFISILFILAGCGLAVMRVRRYREETRVRRAKAFAEMAEIAKKKNVERRMQNVEENPGARTPDPRP